MDSDQIKQNTSAAEFPMDLGTCSPSLVPTDFSLTNTNTELKISNLDSL